jgi:hypothetical protein
MTKEMNWDEILGEIIEKTDADKNFRELFRHTRTSEFLSIDALAEKTGVPEEIITDYESGKPIDEEMNLKLCLWWAETEKTKTSDAEILRDLELVSLLARLILYGTEKQFARLVKFAKSLKTRNDRKNEPGGST